MLIITSKFVGLAASTVYRLLSWFVNNRSFINVIYILQYFHHSVSSFSCILHGQLWEFSENNYPPNMFICLCLLDNRKAMALQGEQLQVVPDIDKEGDDALKPKPSTKESGPMISPPDWDLKMHQDTASNTSKLNRRIAIPHRRLGPPPIRRVSEDARPLTSAEILAHRHLLPS